MTRMGKSIPEPKTVTSSLSAAAKKPTLNTAAGASAAAMKKVYCTPKITFVGETRHWVTSLFDFGLSLSKS